MSEAIIIITKNYTSYTTLTYSIVLVQTRSLFTMPCSEHSKIAFILTHAIPLYPKTPAGFPPLLPLCGVAHLALYLTFSQHRLPSVRAATAATHVTQDGGAI